MNRRRAPSSSTGAGSTPTSQSDSAFENLQALVEVAEKLSVSDGADADLDLGAGFDAVLQNAEQRRAAGLRIEMTMTA